MNDDFGGVGGLGSMGARDIDSFLGGPNPRNVVQRYLDRNARQILPDEVPAGFRVAFNGQLSSMLAYATPPAAGALGTVVTVRTAMGNLTQHDGMVFVKWDNDDFFAVHHAHLRQAPTEDRVARGSYRRVVSNLGDLDGFLRMAGGGETDLVHKATKDLWSLKQSGGEYVIERLFSETGKPLKV
jgi:hypothetical protein